MKRMRIVLMLVASILTTVPLSAHDGHVHWVMGTVTARDARHLEVKTPSGEVLSIAINAKTTATRNKKKVDVREVAVGRRVVVDIGNGADPLIAGEIRLGAALPAATDSH